MFNRKQQPSCQDHHLSPFPADHQYAQNYQRQHSRQSSDRTGEPDHSDMHSMEDHARVALTRDGDRKQREGWFKRTDVKQQVVMEKSSELSLVSIRRDQELSGYEQAKKHIVKEYQAFEEIEYLIENTHLKTAKPNSEPTLKEITSAMEVFRVEFHKKATSIVAQLYLRMISNSLPHQKDVDSDLSYQSKVQKCQDIDLQSDVSLLSLEERNGNSILNELRAKLSKAAKQQIKAAEHKEREQYMQRQKRIEQHIDLKLQKLKALKDDKNMKLENDDELIQFLQQVQEKKTSENVKIYVVKPNFLTQQQKLRFTQKRIVAKSFIRRGYGLNSLRRELTETNCSYRFDESRYKTICYGMATQTFRKLEQFLEEHVPAFTPKMEKIDIRLIAPFLLNCRDNFPQESPIFLKIMQLTYNVDATTVIINKRQTTRLYQKVQVHYQSREDYRDKVDNRYARNDQIKLIQRKAEHCDYREDDWPAKSEAELLQHYIEAPNIAGVRDKYRERYGPGTTHDDCKLIKSRIYKALRAAIRKLKSLSIEHRQLSNAAVFLNSLNNDRIKRILISPDAAEARVGLCKFALARHLNLALAAELVQLIEGCLVVVERRRGDNPDYDDWDF